MPQTGAALAGCQDSRTRTQVQEREWPLSLRSLAVVLRTEFKQRGAVAPEGPSSTSFKSRSARLAPPTSDDARACFRPAAYQCLSLERFRNAAKFHDRPPPPTSPSVLPPSRSGCRDDVITAALETNLLSPTPTPPRAAYIRRR